MAEGGPRIWTPGGEHRPRPQPTETPPTREPTPEEIVEQIKRLRVSDVLLSSVTTFVQLGFAKLGESSRDLEQARLAIEGVRALVPVLQGTVPAEVLRDLQQALANLQLAYAEAAEPSAGG